MSQPTELQNTRGAAATETPRLASLRSTRRDTQPLRLVPSREGPAPRLQEEDAEFLRRASAAALERPRQFTHWILWVSALLLVTAIAWMALAELDVVTVAEGKIIPSKQVQVVQNLEGGIVAEILVSAGQRVEKDQVLMRIDPTRFEASFNEGQAKNQALRAKIVRLSAEAEGKAFVPPPEPSKQNPHFISEEQALFASRQLQLRTNEAVLNQQTQQRHQEIRERRARVAQLRRSHALVTQELTMTRPLLASGAVSEVDLLRLDRQSNDLKGELDTTLEAIGRLEAAQSEMRERVRELGTRFRSEAMEELNRARAEQTALSAANAALEDRVTRTQLRAPLPGMIKQVKVNTVGGVIQPGMDVIEIVPLEDQLIVEARVRPADIAFVRPGQSATVKLSAYDFSIYGGLPATIEHISADTLTLDAPGEKPEAYYRVRLRTNQNKFTKRGESLQIMPGMVATVDIQTGKKTVLEYLLKPILKTKEVAMRER